jgi:hypothetical protein
MFKLDTEQQLLDTFRPKDAQLVQLVPEVMPPKFVRSYLAWKHPAGNYVFLVFAVPNGTPTGIVFESNGGTSAAVPSMCDWCHCYGIGAKVAMLTARLNAKKRVGVYVCSDLSCQQKLEDEADRAGRSVVPDLEKLIERMGKFASDALKIDLFRTP